MRVSKGMLGLGGVGLLAAAALAACGGSDTEEASGQASSSSSSSSSASSSSGDTCAPPCESADPECVALVDNASLATFGLRMSALVVTKPAALATGLVRKVFADAITPSNPGCFLHGPGTFNWLLRFDTTAGTIETGGAKPVADPSEGYSFVDEVVNGVHIQPVVTMAKPDPDTGAFSTATGADLTMPIYLDVAATSVLLLPFHGARFTAGTLSKSKNCIGKSLLPAATCWPDEDTSFVTGASFDAVISLEDADAIIVSQLMESLCVLLSGDSATYGVKNADGITVCKRDGGSKIVLQGDACTAAGQACTDAVGFAADYAASSVRIND